MIKVETLPINMWQENTYILSDETKECVIIDPGCLTAEERKYVADFIDSNGYTPVKLLQTHLHLDHVFGSAFIAEKFNLGMEANAGDEFLIDQTVTYAQQFGVEVDKNPPAISNYLNEGDEVTFGNSVLKVIEVPGHSPGGITFYSEQDKIAIVGDSIFTGSIGRTDLPGGDFDTLVGNLKNKILTLDDEVQLFPGHGPSTTVGKERTTNPFLV
ncbi:MBL fold metallo-hydrolase [Carboxylicivirga caseinilyticus]|uniref:MBL fold metallo-hydrolase n=1 Tax=Carboxylicivirga caseinilyticus TaxID=3417572 RepID=UPI003D338660|nr:MBL fold metallo-hydrolase [Marinilabiliaceae bacterium A049]